MEIKNIWICGIGGVGGYFGGRLANSVSLMDEKKYNIYFLARGVHLYQIRKNGLMLQMSDGRTITCQPTSASDNVEHFPPPNLCLICVKSYDLDDLIIQIKQKLTDNTIIIPLMNGIDIYERIRKNLNKSIVLPSCVYVGSHIERPGLAIQTGNPGFFYSGFDPQHPDFNPQILIDFFSQMNIRFHWLDDPYPQIWEKYLLVASFALVSAHTGLTMGGVIYDEKALDMLKKVMNEIVMIAKKMNIDLPEDVIEHTIEFCKDYPDVKPSYQRDVEKGGKNEGDLFGGAIIRMGKKFNIPTPTTASIYKKTLAKGN